MEFQITCTFLGFVGDKAAIRQAGQINLVNYYDDVFRRLKSVIDEEIILKCKLDKDNFIWVKDMAQILPGTKDGWILVEDALPDEDDKVLITGYGPHGPYVGIWGLDEENEWYDEDFLAWQPLPEPYRRMTMAEEETGEKYDDLPF